MIKRAPLSSTTFSRNPWDWMGHIISSKLPALRFDMRPYVSKCPLVFSVNCISLSCRLFCESFLGCNFSNFESWSRNWNTRVFGFLRLRSACQRYPSHQGDDYVVWVAIWWQSESLSGRPRKRTDTWSFANYIIWIISQFTHDFRRRPWLFARTFLSYMEHR